MERFDVVVLGGGCGGLWLLSEFTRAGFASVLLEESHKLGHYASTRGQNRLHNGSMYLIGAPNSPSTLLSACQEGHKSLLDFCSSEVPQGVATTAAKGVYLYKSRGRRDLALERSIRLGASHGIQLREINANQFGAMNLSEVLRVAPAYRYGIESDEHSFNASKILSRLVVIARAAGAEIRLVGSFPSISKNSQSGTWIVNAGKEAIESPILVLATGVAAVEQFERITGQSTAVGIDLSPIFVCHRVLSDRFVSFQESDSANFIAAAPYKRSCTLTFGLGTRPIKSASDRALRSEDIHNSGVRDAIRFDLPGLGRSGGDQWHFYGCQKVNNSETSSHPRSRFGARHYFWFSHESASGLYLYSPGKWTISGMAARDFVSNFRHHSRAVGQSARPRPLGRTIEIAEPRASDVATHRMGSARRFRPLFWNSLLQRIRGID